MSKKVLTIFHTLLVQGKLKYLKLGKKLGVKHVQNFIKTNIKYFLKTFKKLSG